MARFVSTYDVYGRFVETYTKHAADTVILLGNADERAAARAAGRLRRLAYVSRSLLVAIAEGDWLHADEWIRVRFVADESPAYPVEADRLTPTLYRTIDKAVRDCLASPATDAATRATVTARFAEVRRVAELLAVDTGE
jgi:hypothetical protein